MTAETASGSEDFSCPVDGLTETRFEVDTRGIAMLTLERPAAGNSRNQRMRQELMEIYDVVASSDTVKVLVLTGSGDRAFCAGMDLKESAGPETALRRRERLASSRDIEQLASLTKPTIAAVNGYALGGGCEMALACDLRVMADEARLALPELSHGLVPGGGATQRLPRIAGTSVTYEMLYLGLAVYGPEAVTRGLATCSVPRAELIGVVTEMAAVIAGQPATALRYAKQLVLRSQDTPLHAGLQLELDSLLALLAERSRLAGTEES